MRQLTGAVRLITHSVRADRRAGLTATAVTFLSTNPPSLLACVNRNSSSYPGLAPGVAFGVNVLGADHRELADRFAGRDWRETAPNAFAKAAGRSSPSGAPLFSDALAAFDCEVEDIIERHTHAIVIGRVKRSRPAPAAARRLLARRLRSTRLEPRRAVARDRPFAPERAALRRGRACPSAIPAFRAPSVGAGTLSSTSALNGDLLAATGISFSSRAERRAERRNGD